jgi:hypothetical protein
MGTPGKLKGTTGELKGGVRGDESELWGGGGGLTRRSSEGPKCGSSLVLNVDLCLDQGSLEPDLKHCQVYCTTVLE